MKIITWELDAQAWAFRPCMRWPSSVGTEAKKCILPCVCTVGYTSVTILEKIPTVAENTYLFAKCEDLEARWKSESGLGRLVNKIKMHDWRHKHVNDRRIENCKESESQLAAHEYDKKENLRYEKWAIIKAFNKCIMRQVLSTRLDNLKQIA